MRSSRRAQLVASAVVITTLIVGGLAANSLIFSGASSAPTCVTIEPTPPTAKEKSILTLINRQRTTRGLKALAYDRVSACLARQHNADMIKRNYFSHDEPGGPTYAQRVHAVLVAPGRNELGENIVYGNGPYGTAQGLVTSWMNSPPHRANILNPAFHRTGLGVATSTGVYQGSRGITVATQDFSN